MDSYWNSIAQLQQAVEDSYSEEVLGGVQWSFLDVVQSPHCTMKTKVLQDFVL